MLDLLSAFDDFSPDLDMAEPPEVDGEFITDFLLPFFRDLPREPLAAKVAEVIHFEQDRLVTGSRPR